MIYLGVTQQSASWLLDRRALRAALHDVLQQPDRLRPLQQAELAEGPLRMAASSDGDLVAVWNVDYLSGTGQESWGFIRLAQPNGIFGRPGISPEVFERCLYVINQRLQALLIDTAYIHRTQGGAHTCLAGRGEDARQVSIAFKELNSGNGDTPLRSIICVGPVWDFDELTRFAEKEFPRLQMLREAANSLISPLHKRPILDDAYFGALRGELVPSWQREPTTGFENIEAKTEAPSTIDVYRTFHWTYDDWATRSSPLSTTQRNILESDAIERHPIRIIGPGGSGKTLLMLLMTMRLLRKAESAGSKLKILYIVHNQQMANKIKERFSVLGGDEFLTGASVSLEVCTLSSIARRYLGLEDQVVIDVDAERTKEFQLETVQNALCTTLSQREDLVNGGESNLLKDAASNPTARDALARLIMAEISVAIKAHELSEDRKRYVESERALSRLHGILGPREREFVYAVFEAYHNEVFENLGVLDSDDLAISLLGRLRTPISQLRRKTEGFDYVMVDETQLFNENERKIFALLTKGTRSYVPIALALDEAQEPYGQSSAGLGVLGISQIENETLPNTHRSTKQIIDVAFFVLQKTTDLFSIDFPDYTAIGRSMTPDGHSLAQAPAILEVNDDARNLGRFVGRKVGELRKANVRQIGVVCHADIYWRTLEDELLKNKDLPLHILRQRGESISPDQPVVVLSRPSYVGGQEFDAVIAVGLEQGIAPPVLRESPALSAALEQQVLREMYLSFTRARYRLYVILAPGASPNGTLQSAIDAGLVEWERRQPRLPGIGAKAEQ